MRKRLENYRQNVEGELLAMITVIIATSIVGLGLLWSIVFVIRWLVFR